jgi:DNA-binding winged helix-turn-helix (wHTH) protein
VATTFRPFALDRDRRQLLEAGVEVHLSPKAYGFLSILIEQRSRAVSKAELQERLWPDTFVQEANLTVLATEVRRALRDTGRRRRFIRTVHGFGYAFVAEVEDDLPPSLPTPEVPAIRTPRPDPVRCWVVHGDHETMLGRGEHLIGRDGNVSVHIDLVTASRHHAKLVVSDAGATITDLGSKNGTWLRGARVTGPVALADGDEVLIGHARIVFRAVFDPVPTKSG